jgi:putative ABC transport system permease protein
MRMFRSPLLNWMVENPTGAVFALMGLAILMLAILPFLLYCLPIRKVPLRYNLRNLQSRWKTTLVTALAFTLVTGLLTVMLSFLKGMQTITQNTGHPGNVLVLADGATDEIGSNLADFSPARLDQELQQGIVKTNSKEFMFVQEVYVVATYTIPNPLPGGSKRRFVQMRGLDKPELAAVIHGIEIEHGGWPSPSGVAKISESETAPEIVLGYGLARAFGADVGKPLLMPGDIVQLGPRKWSVCGIMREANSTFGSEIWTGARTVQESFGRTNSYSTYAFRTANKRMAELAVKLLKNFRNELNVQAFTEEAYYSKLSQTSQQFSGAIYFVAIIMALGGVLGIMNTMFAAISQRGKDIGVLRLMGYRRWQILLSFQLESLLIAMMGGLLGCVVAYLLFDGRTASSIITSASGGGKGIVLRLTFDAGVLLSGAIFSLVMGAVGGFVPSVNAMRLRPLESLK